MTDRFYTHRGAASLDDLIAKLDRGEAQIEARGADMLTLAVQAILTRLCVVNDDRLTIDETRAKAGTLSYAAMNLCSALFAQSEFGHEPISLTQYVPDEHGGETVFELELHLRHVVDPEPEQRLRALAATLGHRA